MEGTARPTRARHRGVFRAALVVLAVGALGCSGSGSGAGGSSSSTSTRPTTVAPSEIAPNTLLSAAFGEFAASGDAYADLHHEYLGVTQPAPDPSECDSWPKGDVGTRTIRLGFVSEVPLHTVDESGAHVGFEADLATELVRRINKHYPDADVVLEWVPVDVTLPIGPAKNSTEFAALADGLRAGDFDVAFSSVLAVPDPDVEYMCATTAMFPGVAYTGRDGLDVSGIHDRESLVDFLVENPGMTFVHGMGVSVYDALAADVTAAGGSISVAPAGTPPHFRMADILGLAKGAVPGSLLDVNPRLDSAPKSVFALAGEVST